MHQERIYKIFLEQRSVTTDSRNVHRGQLFFALKGEHFDGNLYARQALEAGASYCIVSDPNIQEDPRIIYVPDTLIALQQLAGRYRDDFKIPVVAITGSNGKTTTKELLATCLRAGFNLHVTKGNLNNHIGVPLTLLSMDTNAEMALIEMGANHQGEIMALCQIAKPTHGVITNIGNAHLEGFGNLEGVKIAKSELFDYLEANGGVQFINRNEPSLDFITLDKYSNLHAYDSDQFPHITNLDSGLYLELNVSNQIYSTRLVGNYNFNNALTAFRIGQYFDISPTELLKKLVDYQPSNNRSQTIDLKGVQFILDAYNANPSSVKLAIENLARHQVDKRSLVLGDMKELGSASHKLHHDVLMLIQSLGGWDQVYLIGNMYHSFEDDFEEFVFFKTTEEANQQIDWNLMKGQTVLLKGSRSLGLESLLPE